MCSTIRGSIYTYELNMCKGFRWSISRSSTQSKCFEIFEIRTMAVATMTPTTATTTWGINGILKKVCVSNQKRTIIKQPQQQQRHRKNKKKTRNRTRRTIKYPLPLECDYLLFSWTIGSGHLDCLSAMAVIACCWRYAMAIRPHHRTGYRYDCYNIIINCFELFYG